MSQDRISPKRLRAAKIVRAVLEPNATYEQVGRDIIPHAKNPRQSVYSALQKPAAQAELARIAKAFDPDKIRDEVMNELNEAAGMSRRKDRPEILIQATMGKAKVAGILIDKVQDVTEKGNIRDMQAEADTVLSSLTVSTDGIRPGNGSQSNEDEAIQGQADTGKG